MKTNQETIDNTPRVDDSQPAVMVSAPYGRGTMVIAMRDYAAATAYLGGNPDAEIISAAAALELINEPAMPDMMFWCGVLPIGCYRKTASNDYHCYQDYISVLRSEGLGYPPPTMASMVQREDNYRANMTMMEDFEGNAPAGLVDTPIALL